MTFVAGAILTAAQMNTYVKNNMLETAPAKASVTDRLIVTDGANSVREQPIDVNTWTPTWGSWTIGSSGIAAEYILIRRMFIWRLRMTLSADATPSGTMAVTLPFAVSGSSGNTPGGGIIWDAGTSANRVPVTCRLTGTTMNMYASGGLVTATSPFTWVENDELALSGAVILTSAQTWQP